MSWEQGTGRGDRAVIIGKMILCSKKFDTTVSHGCLGLSFALTGFEELTQEYDILQRLDATCVIKTHALDFTI